MAGRVVSARLGASELVEFDGRQWICWSVSPGPDDLQCTLKSGADVVTVPFRQIVLAAVGGESPSPAVLEEDWDEVPELAELSLTKQAELLQRYADLQEMDGRPMGGVPVRPQYAPDLPIKQRTKTKSAELTARGETKVSPTTLHRQLIRVRADGVRGLIHRNTSTIGRRLISVEPELLDAAALFLESQKRKARVSKKRLVVLLAAELERQGFDTSELTRYRLESIVEDLSRGRGLHLVAKSRQTRDNKPFRTYGSRAVSAPGEIVQIDATHTTIHVWDPKRGWVPAVVLSAIDVYSRCIVALRVVVGAVTTRDLALLLWDIGKPMVARASSTAGLDSWPGVPERVYLMANDADAADARVIGPKPAFRPATIVLDHGSENDSEHIFAVARQMGIDIVFCPPRTPHAKGIIESWHNTLREVQSLLPGFKGESPVNHPKHAEASAVMSAAELRDAIWTYVIDVYHHRAHRGMRDASGREVRISPRAAFEAFLAKGGSLRVPQDPYRYIEFLSTQRCAINDYGINLDRRIYNSAAVLEMRQHLQRGLGAASETLLVYYDRWDTNTIFARHPATRAWVAIPRVGADRRSSPPYSDLVVQEVRRRAGRDVLTDEELFRREVDLSKRWHEGEVLKDRDEQRKAAIERGRSQGLAFDRFDSPREVRELVLAAEPVPTHVESYLDDDAHMIDEADHFADDDEGWGDIAEALPW